MTTQKTRMMILTLALVGIPYAKFTDGQLEQIKSKDIGAIYMDVNTQEIRVLSVDEAGKNENKPGQNEIALQSTQKLKGEDGQYKLVSLNVTTPVGIGVSDEMKMKFAQIAMALKGSYAGRYHDGDYGTANWLVGENGTEKYDGQFFDTTKAKDFAGKPVLILLGDGGEDPILQIIDETGAQRSVLLIGNVKALKDMAVDTISRPFWSDNGQFLTINGKDGTLALLEMEAKDDGSFTLNVKDVVNENGEVQVATADGEMKPVKALVGPQKDGDTFGVITDDGAPISLDADGRDEVLKQVFAVG